MIRRRKFRFYKGQLKDILKLILLRKVCLGEYIELFEEKFAQYIGAGFAISVCSGRHGLELLLDAFDLKEGDEIIMPAYTLKDLIYLIEKKGFKPKFVDIERSSFNINVDLIEEQINLKTKVIIATHIFGLPCNLEKILVIAQKYGLKVIEDCAHALGAEYKGKRVGSFGDAAFFSFEVLKSINTFGGGMITTNNKKIADLLREKVKQYPSSTNKILTKILFNYFEYLLILSPFYPWLISFFMFEPTTKIISKLYLLLHHRIRAEYTKFTNLQALIGIKQLESLDERNKKRNILAYKLSGHLPANILLQQSEFSKDRIFYFFVVKLSVKNEIEKIRRKFIIQGVDVGIKDEITDNCSSILGNSKDCPTVDEIFNSNLQLPLYDEMNDRQIGIIVRVLDKIFYG